MVMPDEVTIENENAATPEERRSEVFSLDLKTKEELYNAYMPFIKGGGLFIATDKAFNLGDEIFILLKLVDEKEKFKVAGKVVWITPPHAQGRRRAGIGVQFTHDEGTQLRNKIETYLAGALQTEKSTETL